MPESPFIFRVVTVTLAIVILSVVGAMLVGLFDPRVPAATTKCSRSSARRSRPWSGCVVRRARRPGVGETALKRGDRIVLGALVLAGIFAWRVALLRSPMKARGELMPAEEEALLGIERPSVEEEEDTARQQTDALEFCRRFLFQDDAVRHLPRLAEGAAGTASRRSRSAEARPRPAFPTRTRPSSPSA